MTGNNSILEMFSLCCCSRRSQSNRSYANRQNQWDTVRLYSDDEDEGGFTVPGYTFSEPQPQTSVRLDIASAGQYAVIVKNNTRLCGSGGARANTPIAQDKAYFEVKIQSEGSWAIGLCHKKVKLESLDDLRTQPTVWALFNDGNIYHDSSTSPIARLEYQVQEGDTIGIFYDHTELRFAVNGVLNYVRLYDSGSSNQSGVTGIRGTVYPVVAVSSGAIIDSRFSSFQHPPKNGFTEILMEHDIL